ncbi:FadR/GntR family transcriptional regulator [Brevibacterium marinum]|uniref:GntR family transcriptional repressor for pyruvate dehydrogenase complex n=1 Tax=Brevibacterium marinum TaxID=418643 RepID=A0A846RWB8_9MICO|nr:FadR/GntR family transcriptional regulator [Brevibacterium marinum]NJC55370.1 GntR family transcriptional repressor for pyruvate dehydrogenase complex [Brevibacterium marinum]
MASNLSTAVISALRSEILSGTLSPGTRLPTEAALIERFSVSRTVIRESLGHLRAEGLIRSVRGSGSFVLAQPTGGSSLRQRSHGGAASPTTGGGSTGSDTHPTPPVDHGALLEFRISLESEAAALGASRRTAAELATIAGALDSFDMASADPAASLQADLDFHRAVTEASHNPYFTAALDDLGPAMIPMPDGRLKAQRHHLQAVNQEHAAVHSCIRAGDPLGASAAMRTHLIRSLHRLGENSRQG